MPRANRPPRNRVVPLTAERWDDFVRLFGERARPSKARRILRHRVRETG